ncbi:hypothetical protein H4R33_005200 [Dimargaris cristalligena]|nr:hypothetical protein H4R33_005200 [Dimargaris cristalligena]
MSLSTRTNPLPPQQRPIHVVIRVPWNRPANFVEPTATVWTKAKQRTLWYHISQNSRNSIDWEMISRQLGIPIPELMRFSTFLYEKQIQQLKEQLYIHEQQSPHSSRASTHPATEFPLLPVPSQAMLVAATDSLFLGPPPGSPVAHPKPDLLSPSTHSAPTRSLPHSESPVSNHPEVSIYSNPLPPPHVANMASTLSRPDDSDTDHLSSAALSTHLANANIVSVESLSQLDQSRAPTGASPLELSNGDAFEALEHSVIIRNPSRDSQLNSTAPSFDMGASLPMTASTSLTSPLAQSLSPQGPTVSSVHLSTHISEAPNAASSPPRFPIYETPSDGYASVIQEATAHNMVTVPLVRALPLTSSKPPSGVASIQLSLPKSLPQPLQGVTGISQSPTKPDSNLGPNSLPPTTSYTQSPAMARPPPPTVARLSLGRRNEALPLLTRLNSHLEIPVQSATSPGTPRRSSRSPAVIQAESASSRASSISGYSSFSDLSDSSVTQSAMVDAFMSRIGSRVSIFSKKSQLFPWK